MASFASQLRNRLGLLKSYVLRKPRVPGGPLTLAIESTAKCNLFCPMCERETIYFPPKDMELALFKRIIDEVKDYLEFAVPYGAGEPLLNPEIYEMLAYCKNVGVPTGISTKADQIGARLHHFCFRWSHARDIRKISQGGGFRKSAQEHPRFPKGQKGDGVEDLLHCADGAAQG
jgi:hypothetical protein